MQERAQQIFWQAFALAEGVNSVLAYNLFAPDSSRRHQVNSKEMVKAAILEVARGWASGKGAAPVTNLWSQLTAHGVSITGAAESEINFLDIVKYMLQPATLQDPASWATSGESPYLGRVQPVRRLRRVKGFPECDFWDEALDSIAVAQGAVEDLLGIQSPEESAFLVQSALSKTFSLYHDASSHAIVRQVCFFLNTSFFNAPFLTTRDLHTRRSLTVNVESLVDGIATVLARGGQAETHPTDELRLKALGILIFCRFCKMFRMRFYRPVSGTDVLPCVSALRNINPGYLAVRMFGFLGLVPGLNFVFKGGFLPRIQGGRNLVISGPPGAGKTALCLQQLITVCSRGGIAAYLSLEEPYELIVSRLLAFGLVNPRAFRIFDLLGVAEVGDGESSSEARVNSVNVSSGAFYRTRLEKVVQEIDKAGPEVGAFVLLTFKEGLACSIEEILAALESACSMYERRRAIGIDSLNALLANDSEAQSRTRVGARRILSAIFRTIERGRLLGIMLNEQLDDNVNKVIPFLADTFIDLYTSSDGRERLLNVRKCRSQDYHSGPHPFKLLENRGFRVYPSVSAVRASLRHRNMSTLSEIRSMPLPHDLDLEGRQITSVPEKGALLIYGRSNSRKTRLALGMALSTPVASRLEALPSRSILIVTFRTTERSYAQEIRARPDLRPAWDRLGYGEIRWFSPGDRMSAAQLLAALRDEIRMARRKGLPLDRVVFDEVEAASVFLPSVKDSPLLWATIVQLMSAEAISTFFVFGRGWRRSQIFERLFLSCDWVLYIARKNAASTQFDEGLSQDVGSGLTWKEFRARFIKYPDIPFGPQSEVANIDNSIDDSDED